MPAPAARPAANRPRTVRPCSWHHAISNEQAALLDRALDRQMTAMSRAADRLDAQRMAAQSQAFVRALQANAIVAADFDA
jgi:hypothetical protein